MKSALLALFALIKVPLAQLLASKKAWTVIIGLTARGLAKHGIVLPPDMANEIALAFGGLLVTYGVQDHGKAAAQVHAASMNEPAPATVVVDMTNVSSTQRQPQGGFAQFNLLLVIALGGALIGCAFMKSEAKQTGHAIIECVGTETKRAIAEYGPTIDDVLVNATSADGSIDKARVKNATRGFATNTAKCVLADAVARALNPAPADPAAPKSSPLEANPAELRAMFAELAGGATYRTPHGTL
jgi:hypothetical protein